MENISSKPANVIIKDVLADERLADHSASSLSRRAQKRIERSGNQEASYNANEDESSENSKEYLQSIEGLQDQMQAMFIDMQRGFMTRDEKTADLAEEIKLQGRESVTATSEMRSALERFADILQSSLEPKNGPVRNSQRTRDSNSDSHKGEFFSGNVFRRDEFVVPILEDHEEKEDSSDEDEIKREAARTMLDRTPNMSDLMKMGSHGKSWYDARDGLQDGLSTIKKVNFSKSRERDFRHEEKGRGFRVKGGARAPSIEQQPEASYSDQIGQHPLNHPYGHSGNFPRHRLELIQGPDWTKINLKLENDTPDAVSNWMRQVANVQALHPGTRLPIWALLSEGMQIRVRALWWDQHKRSLDGNTQFLDLQELVTLLRNSFYPRSVVMFVDLFKRLVGDDHLKLMPSNYMSTCQNLQPMVRVVNALAGNVSHALAVILGDQVRAKRDISPNVLPALDYRGSEDASAPGFMRIWCSFLPQRFGRFIHDKLASHVDFRNLETYEDYITLWLRFFDAERKFSEEVVAQNATMRFYVGGSSHKSSEGSSDTTSGFKTSYRGTAVSDRGTAVSVKDMTTPKRFFSQKNFNKPRQGVSSVHEFEGEGNDEQLEPDFDVLDESVCEEIDRLCVVNANKPTNSRTSPNPTSIQPRPSTLQRSQMDSKDPGVRACYVFTRTGLCENRTCNYSHDASLARKAWQALADQLASSPYADKNYRPKAQNVPPLVALKQVNMMDSSERTQSEDFAVRYQMRSSSPNEGLASIAQDFPHDELPKNCSQSFASSGAREDY